MKHKYTLWAWSLDNIYTDFKKTIYKRRKLTAAEEKKLINRFCNNILSTHNIGIYSEGINYDGTV